MPVINEPNKVIKNTNGTLTAFTFDFKYFEDEDLIVKTITPEGAETLAELDTDYTVYSADKNAGGTVTFVTAPATGTLLIKRQLPLEQGANFRPVSGFPEQVITDALDRGMMVDQDLQEQLKRSLLAQEGSSVTDLTIPNPEAGKAIVWKDDLTGLRNSAQSVDDIDDSVAAAAASAALAQAAMGVVPSAVNNTYWKRNSSGNLVNMTPGQVREDLDPAKVSFGDITSNPTFQADTAHEGFIKASISPSLPSTTNGKLKNVLFDFNIQPGRSFTLPSNAKFDYGAVPSLQYYPDLALSVATVSNMVVTLPGTTGQLAALSNVPFYSALGGTGLPWEIIINFTRTTGTVLQQVLYGSGHAYAPTLQITAANKFALYLSSNYTSWNVAAGTTTALGTYTVPIGTNLYVKVAFTGTAYTVSYSTDGINWTVDITVTSSTATAAAVAGFIGIGGTPLMPATVDLTKCSAKVNGGRNLLLPEDGIFVNRIIFDTQDGGTKYKAHYSQISVV